MMRARTAAWVLTALLALLGGACSSRHALDLGDDFAPVAGEDGGAGEGGRGGSDGSDGGAGEDGDSGEPDSGSPPECTSHEQCPSEAPRCDDGRCVECTEDAHCTDGERSVCSEGQCIECEGDDCEEPACEGEDCGQACIIDQDCVDSERAHCREQRCVECTEDAHCTENGEPHSCDLIEGVCE